VLKQNSTYKIPQGRARIQPIACNVQQNVEQQNVDRNLRLKDERLVLYTKPEAAEILNVSEAAISAWITQRKLKPTKVGRCTRISLAEIRRFLDSGNKRH
jgi:excisionase family DNA binding protein